MKCSKRKALLQELSNDWFNLNLAARALITIGIIVFLASLFVAFYNHTSEAIYKSIEVVFRSSVASIFGFILSSNIKSNTKNSENRAKSTEEDMLITLEECDEYIEEHNYEEGNSVQLLLASLVCIISTFSILTIYVLNLGENIAAISQLRDLMCTSIGFLLGESKIKK